MIKKDLVAVDIEILPNYFLAMFKGVESGKVVSISMFGDHQLTTDDRKKLHRIMSNKTTFGFNSIKYDLPLIHYALEGATPSELYKTSKMIIEKNMPDWMTYRSLDIEKRNYDHFDVAEPSPAVMISLKNYGTRIGSPKLQDFYLDPNQPIGIEGVAKLKAYCENDLDVTIDLFNAIEDRIELRESMSGQYELDLRSKSDAQIAETVITSELNKLGVNARKPSLPPRYKPTYKAPDYIKFETPELELLLADIEDIYFDLAANGSVKMPKELANKKIVIGNTTYKMGIGGLHSQEKSMAVVSDSNYVMRNADFDAYYPFIILGNKLFPKHLGSKFLKVYRNIVERRMKAKQASKEIKARLKTLDDTEPCALIATLKESMTLNDTINSSLKIVINGSFGKFGSKYSKLYSPDMLLATTITGQLTLLMLIEQLEKHGIPVVSANTDGVEYYCPRDKIALAETIIFDLELATGYTMEHGEYHALYAKDVNNYVAVYDGEVKAKGIYAKTTLSKGRSTPIVYEAVRKYLLNGTCLAETIMSCHDVNEFVSARTVKGGGVYNGEYLGKMCRWYYSTESEGYISYKLNGNKVPKTDGCRPMMDLPNDKPDDLDYRWYIDEAITALANLGVDYAN